MFPPTRSDPSPLAPRDTAPAKPCRVALGIPPIDFAAPLGVIDLNLIVTQGNFAFVPAGCSVTGPASTNVPPHGRLCLGIQVHGCHHRPLHTDRPVCLDARLNRSVEGELRQPSYTPPPRRLRWSPFHLHHQRSITSGRPLTRCALAAKLKSVGLRIPLQRRERCLESAAPLH